MTKLVGLLFANIPDNEKFNPLTSELVFMADGDTYELHAEQAILEQIGKEGLVTVSDDNKIHVKATGTSQSRADNIGLFTASAVERIDL